MRRRALLTLLLAVCAGALWLLLGSGEDPSPGERGAAWNVDSHEPSQPAEEPLRPADEKAPADVAPLDTRTGSRDEALVGVLPSGSIAGRVVDEDGRALGGATVSWYEVPEYPEEITTGEDGRFRRAAAHGWHEMDVSAPEGRADLLRIEDLRVRVPQEGARVDVGDLVLKRVAQLRVEVGAPVAHAEIWARQVDGPHEDREWLRKGQSVAELRLVPGRFEVFAHVDRLDEEKETIDGSWARQLVTVPPDGAGVRLSFRPSARVRVRVVDVGGAPLRAAVVVSAIGEQPPPLPADCLEGDDDDLSEDQAELMPEIVSENEAYAVNDADGWYEGRHLDPGRYRVVALPLDLSHGRVEGTVSATADGGEITLVAAPSRSVAIRATKDLIGSTIHAWGPPGLTLEETPAGDILLHGLLPGDRALVHVEGWEEDGEVEWVGSAWASGERDVVVPTTQAAAVHFLVVDGSGKAKGADWEIRFERADSRGLECHTTLDTGEVEFSDYDEPPKVVGSRGALDREERFEAAPFAWITFSDSEGASDRFVLAPGRWMVSLPGRRSTLLELHAGEERNVRVTVR